MSFRHINRVWKLPLPSTAKFILMALAAHAKETDDICWPGVDRLVDHTRFNKKTIYRGLKKLEQLGLITIDKTRKYNTYTLYISGDLESLIGYLEFYCKDLKSQEKEPDSIKKDPKSPKLIIENISLIDKKNKKLNLCASANSGGTLPAKQEDKKGEKCEQLIKPSELWASLEKIWKDHMEGIFDGQKFKFTPKDRWNLESYKEILDKSEYPTHTILEKVLDEWKTFCSHVKSSTDNYSLHSPSLPKTDFLLKYAKHSVKYTFGDDDEEDD